MNRFPIKVTYAVLTMVELGLRHGALPTQAKTIAHNQAIPARFIEQILSALKQAGMVTSLRGAQGGYTLRQHPSETSLAEIVQAISGPAVNSHNGKTNGHNDAPKPHDILLSGVWQQLQEAELAILCSISLQTLVDQYRQLDEKRTLMYHI